MRKYSNLQKFGWILSVLLIVFIWGNSILSPSSSDQNSNVVREWLIAVFGSTSGFAIFVETYVRKIAHFTEYGLLGTVLMLTVGLYKNFSWQRLANLYAAGLTVAVADESIQLLSGRGSMVRDVLLDMCGFLILSGVAFGIAGLLYKRKRRKD